MCHHGARSARAVDFLLRQHFAVVYNVDGGIDDVLNLRSVPYLPSFAGEFGKCMLETGKNATKTTGVYSDSL
jgi:hypothetical protein